MRWARDNAAALVDASPADVPGMGDRAADNWEALFAIADLGGTEWIRRVRECAAGLGGHDDDDDELGVLLLSEVPDLFSTTGLTA